MHATSPCSAFAPENSTSRGSALLELLVVTPFLVGAIFATVDLSVGMKQQAAMVEAARVAARAAAILPPNSDDGTVLGAVFGAASASLESSGIADDSVAIDVDTPPIPSNLLAAVITFKQKLTNMITSNSSPANKSQSPSSSTVRFVRVRVSAKGSYFFPHFASYFTPKTVMSTFPLAAGNSLNR